MQDLLDQHRKLSTDRDSTTSKLRIVTDEVETLRHELSSCDQERMKMQEKMSMLEREVSKHLQVN